MGHADPGHEGLGGLVEYGGQGGDVGQQDVQQVGVNHVGVVRNDGLVREYNRL